MPASRIKVRDIDHGWDAFKRSIHAFERQKPRIRTGVLGAKAEAPHVPRKKGRGKKADNDNAGTKLPLTIAQIAQIHEFGLGRMPERSFLRANFDAHGKKYQRALVAGVRRELLAATQAGIVLDISNTQTLKRLALQMEGDIKRRIRGKIPPPNTPATIRRKGSSTPLVDTGQLISSLTSEIVPAGAR